MVNKNSTLDPAILSQVDTWIFDLDNTLYPETSSLFDEINHKMNLYMADLLDMTVDAASHLRQGFYEIHGTTLNGLMQEYGADPHPFLDFVHRIDLSPIAPAPLLKTLLDGLPGRRLIHTNGTIAHAERVLEKLGIAECFEGIFDIVASDFKPKPKSHAFSSFLEAFGINPQKAIMFEDKPENLEVPHALGMATVWINHRAETEPLPDFAHVHHLRPDVEGFLQEALDQQLT